VQHFFHHVTGKEEGEEKEVSPPEDLMQETWSA